MPLASTATARGRVRVLPYPKCRLAAPEQQDLLADDLPWETVVHIPDPPPAVPACRAPFDVPFLHPAIAGLARALFTGDRALLALVGTRGPCTVTAPDAFAAGF